MHVVTRKNLAPHVPADLGSRLLLEGSWPDTAVPPGVEWTALDDVIDSRFGWIDEAAARLAERIIADSERESENEPSFFFVNALRLRYAAVKWLRIVAWRRSQAAAHPGSITLHVSQSPADEEYVALWQALTAADGTT